MTKTWLWSARRAPDFGNQGQFDDKQIIKDDVISLLTNWIDKHVANADKEMAAEPGKAMEANADLTRQARGHYKIAEGSMLLNDPEVARDHLLTVLRIARGTGLAQKATRCFDVTRNT